MTGQYLYKYQSPDGTCYKTIDNIYDNIVSEGQLITKLGIKAPPGTQVKINNSIFTIGSSGVFSINKPGYTITNLNFIKPVKLQYNEEATKAELDSGLKLMDTSLTNFLNNSKATITASPKDNINEKMQIKVENQYNVEESDELNLNQIITNQEVDYTIYSTFLSEFTKGYQKYALGLKGIYTVAQENDGTVIYGDLENIIIDYEIKEDGSNE